MLLVNQLENLGDIRGVMYDFEKAGDILPKHNHDENTVHITIVARGKLKAYSHDWKKEAVAGQLLDFRAGEPHELMALEDNTRIFNIVKKFGGEPNDYQQEQI
jgi:quercetin dioxygenase-like cupin family protein